MDQVVVGVAQLRLLLPQDQAEIEQSLARFMRMAQSKRVRLLVLPQFTGLLTTALEIKGARTNLLKQADQARRTNASLWTRTRARLAGGAAGMLRANFSQALENALAEQPEAVWERYTDLFGGLARHYALTVVAGTSYLLDPSERVVRHLSLVFGPDGQLLGQQAAVTLPPGEHPAVQAGRHWRVIQTPVGRLGILIGTDMLYPEPGRLLAYAGAEVLVGLGASPFPVTYHRQRQGLLARVEENQLYGALSFAVGYNPFTPADDLPFVGRSLVAAPLSMTPRFNGILVEMGTDSTEGLITAEWNYPALRDLWVTDPAPVRATMPMDAAGPPLSVIYGRRLTIEQATRIGELDDTMLLAEPDEREARRDARPAPEATGDEPGEDGAGFPADAELGEVEEDIELASEGDTPDDQAEGEPEDREASQEHPPAGNDDPAPPESPLQRRWPWSST